MKRRLMMVVALLLASPLALANEASGELVELTDTRIVVKKGKKDLEIARDAGTRMTGDVKVGDRVTVGYKMTATSIEPKARKKTKTKSKNKDL